MTAFAALVSLSLLPDVASPKPCATPHVPTIGEKYQFGGER